MMELLQPFCGPEGFGPFAPKEFRVDLTPCFEEMILFLSLYACMIFFGSIRLWMIWSKPVTSFENSLWLFWTKNILIFLLLICSGVELVLRLLNIEESYGYQIISPCLSFVATFIALLLNFREQIRVKRTSPILLLYWFGIVIVDCFKIRTQTLTNVLDTFFIITCVTFGLEILIFIFSNFPFPRGIYHAIGDEDKECPEERANFFSILTFGWINPLMILGSKKTLEQEDLWALHPSDTAFSLSENFEAHWNSELERDKPSLMRALVKSFGWPFLVAGFFKLGQDVLAFVQPILLEDIMQFIDSYCDDCETQYPTYRGYLIAVAMFVTAVAQTILLHQYFHRCFTTGMRVRGAIVTAVYKKSFKLSNDSKQTSTVGEIVNHMAIDAQKLMDLCSYFHIVWSGPMQIVLALVLLYNTLGPSIFAGVFIMISVIPLNAWLAAKMKTLQETQMKNKDNRIKLMDEILSGIKIIKLYAWEIPFIQKIFNVRNLELSMLKKIAYVQSIQTFTWTSTPFLVSLASFLFYTVVQKEPLTSEKAFVSLSLFNLLQFPLVMLPNVIASCVEANVAVNRLYKYLLADELDPDSTLRINPKENPNSKVETNDFKDEDEEEEEEEKGENPNKPLIGSTSSINEVVTQIQSEDSVTILNGQFKWRKMDQAPALNNINFRVKTGSLLAIVGTVGSGKSSLCSAILGDMIKSSGQVIVKGSVAYVSQQAWIMNTTLKDNILFGHDYDEKFYQETIQNCALVPDIQMLPGGDETEIGEKGINLSGGQKQRVSIARSVFSNADIYLFDDPLSAVDAHVGGHIFEKVIGSKGMLKNKTRILVTHGIQYLAKADQIIVMKNGKISEIGSYNQLIEEKGEFSKLISEFSLKQAEEEELTEISEKEIIEPTKEKIKEKEKEREKGVQIITKETSEVGKVDLEVYKMYFGSMGFVPVILLIAFYFFGQVAQIGMNLWLSYWSAQNSNDDVGLYLGVYSALGMTMSIFGVAQTIIVLVVCGLRAAGSLHESLLQNIIRAPMSFYDTTPLGRIINRFSKDQSTIDEVLPRTFQSYFRTLFSVIGILVAIAYSTYYFLIAIIPLGILYYYIQRYYLATSRELKRLDSVSRSPLYANFSETINGLVTIRAYKQVHRFIKINEQKLDLNQTVYYPNIASNRWLAVRLEIVGAFVVLLSALFAVIAFKTIDSATVGFSVTYALSITQTLNWMVRMSCDIEANIVSVERVKEYSQTPTEAPAHIPETQPPKPWPSAGVVKFDNYSTRYRKGLDLVLKQINCVVNSTEKIGVVGRTGAGKSSLTLALFRIVESVSGEINIDGVNISVLGLEDLRSNLTIIPQDPVLFSGTLRENLDPFSLYSDEQIWKALTQAHLLNYVESLEKKLDHEIIQGGENLSVGQRQLICLGRALLRKSKVLVLDEATAAVDVETDDIVQKTIRKEFHDCTIITIAHRINTIMDSDRILVLDQGEIREFDSPKNLISDPSSLFFGLARESGLA